MIIQHDTCSIFRTAAAVRSVAISFLWAMLQSGLLTDAHLTECFKDINTQVKIFI